MTSSDTYSSTMPQQEVAWLKVRFREGDRSMRKKLRVSLPHLAAMNLGQFIMFLMEKLELQQLPTVTYCDDDGDEIPVTNDDELNVMVYMAEIVARQGQALDLRLRDRSEAAPPAAGDRSLTSARQLSKQAKQMVAARAKETQGRHERRRCELHPNRESRRVAERRPVPGEPRPVPGEPRPVPGEPRPVPAEPRPVPAEPADPLWRRVDAWQRGCLVAGAAAGESGSSEETPEDGWWGWWRRQDLSKPAQLHQPSRSRCAPPPPPPPVPPVPPVPVPPPVPAHGTAPKKEKRREMPPWFATFMGQFQRDLVSEVVEAVRAELARTPGCLCSGAAAACAAAPADIGSTAKPNDSGDKTQPDVSTEEGASTQAPTPDDSSWVATFSDPIPIPGPPRARSPALMTPPGVETIDTGTPPEVGIVNTGTPPGVGIVNTGTPPGVETVDTGTPPGVETVDTAVQTATLPGPPSGGPAWLDGFTQPPASGVTAAAAAPPAAPVDEFGLFSVSESDGSGSGVSSGAGRSVCGVHRGVTVYSAGGRSVETTSTGGGRPALLRSVHSEPAGRPRPRPRRHLTDVEDPDYSCMLVMVEHSAAELEPPPAASGPVSDGVFGDSAATAQPPQSEPRDTQESQVEGSQDPQPQEPQGPQEPQEPHASQEPGEDGPAPCQELPVSVAEWMASEPPPPPPADAVQNPEMETAVKKPAMGPERAPEPEPEPELEEGFVTVNGRRLSLSEDDFSDIVIIASPGGSERFEMVEEEELGELEQLQNQQQHQHHQQQHQLQHQQQHQLQHQRDVQEHLQEQQHQPQHQHQQHEQQKQPLQQQPTAQVPPDACGEAMVTSALSDRWVDAAASLEESGSGGSVTGWAASSAGSELLKSTCESAPAACNITISSPPAAAADRTASLPAGVKLSAGTAAPRPEMIPEQPPASPQEPREPQEPQEPQEPRERPGPVAPGWMEPLSSLPRPLRRRLVESLERIPEPRQIQLASDLTGRRFVETFWDRLGESAASSGHSRMEELLLDQAARPAGVGMLADSLDGMLREIKVSAASSSEADVMGAQAVKHALCLLRDGVRAEETGAGTPPRQETTREETTRQERWEETPRQEAREETPRWEGASQEQAYQEQEAPWMFQEQDQPPPGQEGVYQQQFSSQDRPPPSDAEESQSGLPAWLSSLAGLLPDSVLNMLRHSQRRDSPQDLSFPSEAETLMIYRLVDMGFYDLERMRELYRQFGDDCNTIATHLLGEEP